jgi:hypothetical protein
MACEGTEALTRKRISAAADSATNVGTNKKALVTEGLVAKQMLDLVGCAGKI